MSDERKIDLQNDFTEEEEAVFQVIKPNISATDITEDSEAYEFERTIVSMYKAGVPIKEMKWVSIGRVYEILAKHGVELRNGRYRSKSNDRIITMTALEKKSLIAEYKKGITLAEIYRKYDINKHGVYILLDEAGIPRRRDAVIGREKAAEMVHNMNKSTTAKLKTEPIEISRKGDTLYVKITKRMPTDLSHINVSINLGEE